MSESRGNTSLLDSRSKYAYLWYALDVDLPFEEDFKEPTQLIAGFNVTELLKVNQRNLVAHHNIASESEDHTLPQYYSPASPQAFFSTSSTGITSRFFHIPAAPTGHNARANNSPAIESSLSAVISEYDLEERVPLILSPDLNELLANQTHTHNGEGPSFAHALRDQALPTKPSLKRSRSEFPGEEPIQKRRRTDNMQVDNQDGLLLLQHQHQHQPFKITLTTMRDIGTKTKISDPNRLQDIIKCAAYTELIANTKYNWKSHRIYIIVVNDIVELNVDPADKATVERHAFITVAARYTIFSLYFNNRTEYSLTWFNSTTHVRLSVNVLKSVPEQPKKRAADDSSIQMRSAKSDRTNSAGPVKPSLQTVQYVNVIVLVPSSCANIYNLINKALTNQGFSGTNNLWRHSVGLLRYAVLVHEYGTDRQFLELRRYLPCATEVLMLALSKDVTSEIVTLVQCVDDYAHSVREKYSVVPLESGDLDHSNRELIQQLLDPMEAPNAKIGAAIINVDQVAEDDVMNLWSAWLRFARKTFDQTIYVQFKMGEIWDVSPPHAAEIMQWALTGHQINAQVKAASYGCIAVFASGPPTMTWSILSRIESIEQKLKPVFRGLRLKEIRKIGTRDVDILFKREDNAPYIGSLFDLTQRMLNDNIPRAYQCNSSLYESENITVPVVQTSQASVRLSYAIHTAHRNRSLSVATLLDTLGNSSLRLHWSPKTSKLVIPKSVYKNYLNSEFTLNDIVVIRKPQKSYQILTYGLKFCFTHQKLAEVLEVDVIQLSSKSGSRVGSVRRTNSMPCEKQIPELDHRTEWTQSEIPLEFMRNMVNFHESLSSGRLEQQVSILKRMAVLGAQAQSSFCAAITFVLAVWMRLLDFEGRHGTAVEGTDCNECIEQLIHELEHVLERLERTDKISNKNFLLSLYYARIGDLYFRVVPVYIIGDCLALENNQNFLKAREYYRRGLFTWTTQCTFELANVAENIALYRIGADVLGGGCGNDYKFRRTDPVLHTRLMNTCFCYLLFSGSLYDTVKYAMYKVLQRGHRFETLSQVDEAIGRIKQSIKNASPNIDSVRIPWPVIEKLVTRFDIKNDGAKLRHIDLERKEQPPVPTNAILLIKEEICRNLKTYLAVDISTMNLTASARHVKEPAVSDLRKSVTTKKAQPGYETIITGSIISKQHLISIGQPAEDDPFQCSKTKAEEIANQLRSTNPSQAASELVKKYYWNFIKKNSPVLNMRHTQYMQRTPAVPARVGNYHVPYSLIW